MLVLKDVLRPRLIRCSSGGEEFQPDKYLTDSKAWSIKYSYVVFINTKNVVNTDHNIEFLLIEQSCYGVKRTF